MSGRRRSHPQSYEPMYGWALESSGRPVPIALAERGANDYVCPICHGPMIAKKGAIKQHHFAHENVSACTPERVAQAIGSKWLVLTLGTLMVKGQSLAISWTDDDQPRQANLLEGVTTIVEHLQTRYGVADIALMVGHRIRAVLSLSLDSPMDADALAKFAANGITIVILHGEAFRSGQVDLTTLLDMAEIHGGWWLLGVPDDLPELELDPDTIRQALGQAVSYPPYRFWAPLTDMGMRQNVLRVNNYLLWLPEDMWHLAIGGTHHKLSGHLDIIVQEWPQPDGSTVALYYIKLKSDRAVAVRRFLPGEHVHASLASNFRALRASAEQVAYHLASN